MAETDRNQAGTKGIHRMLCEIIRIAKEASLTGALADGARVSVRQYNASIEVLEENGQLPAGLFRPLPDDTKFDEVGVAAAQLAAYISGGNADEEAEAPRVSGSHNVFIGLGQLKEIKELKEIGQYVRERLPDWLKPKPAETPGAPGTCEAKAPSVSEVEAKMEYVGSRLQQVAEDLRRTDISDERRAELAEELSRLGLEQAQLARELANMKQKQEEASTSS